GLTLGLAALAAPLLVHWRALNPLLLVLVAGTAALIVFGLDGSVSRLEGGVLVVAFVATLAFALSRASNETPELQAELEGFSSTGTDLGLNLLRFAIALVLLYFGSRLVVDRKSTRLNSSHVKISYAVF